MCDITVEREAGVPDVGALGDDPLPATQHGVLYRGQQEALGRQLQHGVDALQPHLRPLQLWTAAEHANKQTNNIRLMRKNPAYLWSF